MVSGAYSITIANRETPVKAIEAPRNRKAARYRFKLAGNSGSVTAVPQARQIR